MSFLDKVRNRDVKTLVCDDVPEALCMLQQEAVSGPKQIRTVVQRWSKLPQIQAVIHDTLRGMASIAYHTWPSWYGRQSSFMADPESFVEAAIQDSLGVQELLRCRRYISSGWIRAAVRGCREGRIPLPEDFSPEVQASQLALAIEPQDLVLILSVEDPDPLDNSLFGLARAAEWLAKQTGARVAVLIPRALAGSSELDSIAYEPLFVAGEDDRNVGDTSEDELKHVVWPIEGRPHPFSPGEKELAKRLNRDPELSSLFKFNLRVETVKGSQYMVDLVWLEGKIIVEIDGYRYHSNRYSFRLDRHRDYELTISGFLTLRIPHDEVIRDPELAIDKIRDLVYFRKRDL